MKIDSNKLYEKLAAGLKENSDSLRGIPIDLAKRMRKDWHVIEMIGDQKSRDGSQRLLDCTFENEDIYDYVFRRNIANEGLVAISAAQDIDHISAFNAKFRKIDDSRLHVQVTETFSISRARGLGKIYDNGERVDFTRMQLSQVIDWICKIVQCSSEEIFDRIERKDLKRLFKPVYSKFFNSDGSLKVKFAELNTYEFLESNLDFESVSREFMPYLITKYWQSESIGKGWSKQFEFEIDYSDLVVHLNKDQLALKEKIKDRIYSTLEESCPFKVNLRMYDSSALDESLEMLTLRMRENNLNNSIDLNQGKFDEELLIKVMEYRSYDELLEYIKDCEMQIDLSIFSWLQDVTDVYKVNCRIRTIVEFVEGSVVYVESYSHRVPTEVCMKMLAEDRNLDFEENYDLLKNEILENYEECKGLDIMIPIYTEIDFKDFYE